MKLEAVLFDAAETLFTTRGSVGEIYGGIAREFGSTASASDIQAAFIRQFRHSGPLTREHEKEWWKDVVHRVFMDVGMVRNFDRYFEKIYDTFRGSSAWILFPETREVLAELKSRGLRLGVISNFDSRAYDVMRSLDILSFFDAVTISSETGYAKPQPEIFIKALQSLRVAADQALLVGDSLPDDVMAARAVGISAVLLDRSGSHDAADTVKTISNLRPLLEMI